MASVWVAPLLVLLAGDRLGQFPLPGRGKPRRVNPGPANTVVALVRAGGRAGEMLAKQFCHRP